MHGKFSGSFPDYTIFICKFTTDECFLFKLETFKSCKEVKQIMIMIIAIICIFYIMWYLKNSWKLLSENPHLEKIHWPLFTHSPLPKYWKIASPPFFANIEKFFESQSVKVNSAQSFRGAFRTQLKILAFVPWIANEAPTYMSDWVLNTYTSEVDNKDNRTTSFMLLLCFYCWLWANFVHWFSCIFDMFHRLIFHCFEQLNTIWERF